MSNNLRMRQIGMLRLQQLYDIETAAEFLVKAYNEDAGFCCSWHAHTAVRDIENALNREIPNE